METAIKKEIYDSLAEIWWGAAGQDVSEEHVVPDTMPDIGDVLDAEGYVTLRGKELGEGYVLLSASVCASVLYAPEDGSQPRSLEFTLPAELRMDAPGADPEGRAAARLRLRNLEARAVNSRKLAIRAELEGDVRCFARSSLEVPVGLQGEEKGVHIRTETAEPVLTVDMREKTFVVTDEYALPAGVGRTEAILSRRVEPVLDDVKYVGGKAVFRGRVISELLLMEEGGRPVSARYETEFSQILEIGDGEGEGLPQVILMVTGAYHDLPEYGRESGAIGAEIHLAAQCVCRRRQTVRYMADIYSNRTELVPEPEEHAWLTELRPVSLRQTVTGRVEAAPPGAELLRAAVAVGGTAVEGNTVKTGVNARLLFRNGDGGCVPVRCRLPVEFTVMDLPPEGKLRDIVISAADVYCGPGPGGADLRVTMRMDALAAGETAIRWVGAVEEDAEAWQARDRAPSVTLVRVPEGAELWTLAKKYRSTPEAIRAANGGLAEGVPEGLLLIPKGR